MIDRQGSTLNYHDNGDIARMNELREKAKINQIYVRGGSCNAAFIRDFDERGERYLYGRDRDEYLRIKSRCR